MTANAVAMPFIIAQRDAPVCPYPDTYIHRHVRLTDFSA